MSRPSLQELLDQLPPLPDLDRPFFSTQSLAASLTGPEDLETLRAMLSGTSLDDLLARVLEALPEVRDRVAGLGPGGLVFRARATNTINAVTIPGRDGVMVVFNLGFASLLSTVATALGMLVGAYRDGDPSEAPEAVSWLAHSIDWATSIAAEPRIVPCPLPVDEGLAANLAGRAQDLALCHELGHVMAETDAETEPVVVAGQPVEAVSPTWSKEYDADMTGLRLHLAVLAHRGEDPVGALVGAELFLNAAAMLTADEDASASTHPPPDERLFRIRQQWAAAHPDSLDRVGPARAVRGGLEALRDGVREQVAGQRAQVRADLDRELTQTLARGELSEDESRAAAYGLAHHLDRSPGATLAFLRDELAAPRGSSHRMLVHNAGLHLEPVLQEVIGLIPPPAR